MNMIEIMFGIGIAYTVYVLLGHFLPARSQGDTPWSASPSLTTSTKRPSRSFAGVGKKFGIGQWFLKNQKYRSRLELLLIRSGYPFHWNVEDLFFFKLVFTVLAILFLWLCDASNWFFWVSGIYVGFQFLDLYLAGKAKNRQAEIGRSLPGFIDLLTLTIEGGLDLMAALERILEKLKAGPLKEELQTIAQETRLGTPRKEALEHWAFRTNLPDVLSLTSMIIQSEEFGTGLSTVLRSYADDMRVRRITKAEEAAGKAPVKLLFPMMVFFFPIVFVIIFGPLAMSFLSTNK